TGGLDQHVERVRGRRDPHARDVARGISAGVAGRIGERWDRAPVGGIAVDGDRLGDRPERVDLRVDVRVVGGGRRRCGRDRQQPREPRARGMSPSIAPVSVRSNFRRNNDRARIFAAPPEEEAMPAYLIVNYEVEDPALYGEYAKAAGPAMKIG